jgi:M6 family metalloprotease-like protein
MKRFFVLALVVFYTAIQQIFAVPAYPNPIGYQLPDGSEITIQLRGDEWVSWAESSDGFTVLRNSEGFWEYAVRDEIGDLKLSGVRAYNQAERTVDVQIFLNRQPKHLRYSRSQIETQLKLRSMSNDIIRSLEGKVNVERKATPKTIEVIKIPVILVGFQDRPFTKTKAEVETLINQPNYTADGLTGSLRDYFYDISHGQLNLQVEIFGPYTLPNPVSFYDNECAGGDSRSMIVTAIDFAFNAGADFSAFHQTPGTNWLTTVHIIFAGYCQASGGSRCEALWSHAGTIRPSVNRGGVVISDYSISPELRGNSGNNLAHIGTMAHELGHSLLGLPDLYDTDAAGSGGHALALGTWCLMASGVHNDNGRTPATISAWGRVAAGWVSQLTLTSAASITIPNPTLTDAIFRINTQTQNEYFLIENREKTRWDAFVPSSGMLIYHIDRADINPWTVNKVNANPERRRNYIKQAGGNAGSTTPERITDTWPQPERTEFTDHSTPNSMSWAGENTEKPITNITRNATEGTISFDFMGGITHAIVLSQTTTHIFPSVNLNYTPQTPRSVTINNIGNEPTGALNIALSGTNPSSFTLSTTSISNIATGSSDNFTIVPNTGLSGGIHTATVTVSGDNNISETFDVSFTINKAPGAMVTAPTLASAAHNSITVNVIANPTNGQSVQYAIHTTNTVVNVENLEWQSGTTFRDLLPETTYYVYARSVENDSFSAGVRSVSVAMRTTAATSIGELISTQIQIYPNPIINGKLHIIYHEWNRGDVVELFDITGKRVYIDRISQSKGTLTIDISAFQSGNYILRIGAYTTKVIKQ